MYAYELNKSSVSITDSEQNEVLLLKAPWTYFYSSEFINAQSISLFQSGW